MRYAIVFLWFVFNGGCFLSVNAQRLVDFLALAEENFEASQSTSLETVANNTTSLSFGYFSKPQQTISGAQIAYAQLLQQLPWIGKGAASHKLQKYSDLARSFEITAQKEVLKFQVKKAYYNMYKYAQQKDAYLVYNAKLRRYLEKPLADSATVKAELKRLRLEDEQTESLQQLQIVDGEYQKAKLQLAQLVKVAFLETVDLPLELAMPLEEGTLSFSDTYENALFLAYENQLLASQKVKSYSSPWLPSIGLGLRYTWVNDSQNEFQQLPAQNIVEPQLHLNWNLFSKGQHKQTVAQIETRLEQKVANIATQLQLLMNDQISARISYFAAVEKIDRLQQLKTQLLQKNVSLEEAEALEFAQLKMNYQLQKIEAVVAYYISSSEMLLYQ